MCHLAYSPLDAQIWYSESLLIFINQPEHFIWRRQYIFWHKHQ